MNAAKVVEADQILSGIGLISNAGARFEAPETISAQGRFEDVHRVPVAGHLSDRIGRKRMYSIRWLYPRR